MTYFNTSLLPVSDFVKIPVRVLVLLRMGKRTDWQTNVTSPRRMKTSTEA